ncbi:uncharacterized protein LOC6576676 [Drosophila mojavensis]|uniref:Uncharacterized protein n=1 Tax=Drosophila mojavensis TaxID=7230 RepID=B4KFY0_DROMO|nr:uncharacterized protein LOC6576676 [Drosophila mojavensis]EDW12106.1 uncharacterized protein Dmoj_GI11542 [Drosophila mojavensis]
MYSSTKLVACALIVAQLVGSIQCGYYDNTDKWVLSDKTKAFPENAVLGGYDSYGYENFVGRVVYSSSVLPARVRAETGYATYNTESVGNQSTSYELLVSNETVSYDWVRSFDGFLERNAVSVGTSATNERVYVCRGRTDGGIFIGTLYLAQRACFIRYENLPMRQLSKYEVLVRKHTPLAWAPFEVQIN